MGQRNKIILFWNIIQAFCFTFIFRCSFKEIPNVQISLPSLEQTRDIDPMFGEADISSNLSLLCGRKIGVLDVLKMQDRDKRKMEIC